MTDSFTIERLSEKSSEQWDAFVDTHPDSSLYHRAVWRDLITELFGHESHYLYARSDTGAVLGVLPLIRLNSRLFGDFVVSMPYFNYGGAIALSAEIEGALMAAASDLADDLGCSHIEFRDSTLRGDNWPVRTDKVTMELMLPESERALWASFGSKLRAQIRRPQKEPVEILLGREDLLSKFYAVFSRNMRDLGTPVYPRQLFAWILETFPKQTSIVVLELRDRPVAVGFLLGFRGRLEIPWASSISEFNRFGVNMLLYWESLKIAIRDGYQVFDFGRSTINSGTHRFKKQWGAEQRQLYWHYWLRPGQRMPQLTPRNPKYRLFVEIWKHLPMFLTNSIGPKIVKSLP